MGIFLLVMILTGAAQAYTSDAVDYNGPLPSTYGDVHDTGDGVLLPAGDTLYDYIKAYTYSSSGHSFKLYTGDMDYSNGYLYNPVPISDEMSFEKLVALIDEQQITTIESVLERLPKHMLDLNYVVMYRSRSLQEASPVAPRVITYTPTARFVLTFNGGDPRHFGAQTLELMQFRDSEKRFEFREIVFNKNGAPVISDANPGKCLECHQSPSRLDVDPRPNWEPYNTWLGAFGSDNGSLKTTPLLEDRRHRLRSTDMDVMLEQAREFEIFKEYVDNIAPTHPRYKYLRRLNLKATTALTEHLGILNFNRIVRLMLAEKEIFEIYKEFIANRLYCYGADHENYPVVEWHKSFEYPQYFDFEQDKYILFTSTQSLITQLYEPLGVDTSDWSTDFGSGGRFSFSGRFGVPSVSKYILRELLVQNSPDFANLERMACAELQRVSALKLNQSFDEGFQERIRSERLRAPTDGKQIFQRCIQCHVSDLQAWIPALPFSDEKALGAKLHEPYSRRGTLLDEIAYRTSEMATNAEQMPRRGRLSAQERDALMEYLGSLPQ